MEYPDEKKRKIEEGYGAGEESAARTEPLTRDELRNILDPLAKEQIIELLINAGIEYSSISQQILEVAGRDPANRKLFVRGLAWDTSTQSLHTAFEAYGPLEESIVITDKNTGKSKGYGFVTYKTLEGAQKALREPSKLIDGRMTVCNLASQGASNQATPGGDLAQRKVYVGSLSYETSSEALLQFFSQFGEIEEGSVAQDKNTNKSRGFAFVTFKSVEGAQRAVAEQTKIIDGRQVTVKLAVDGQRGAQQSSALLQSPLLLHQSFGSPYAANYATSAVGGSLGAGMGLYRPQAADLSTYAAQQAYLLPGVQQQQQQYASLPQNLSPYASQQFQGKSGVPGKSTASGSPGMPVYFSGPS